MDEFTQGYIEAFLWSETDESTPDGGKPLDENYNEFDIHPDSMNKITRDCAMFQEVAKDLLNQAYQSSAVVYTEEQAGHDFLLTRNHHGAGYWDSGLGEVGDKLTTAAQLFREVNGYAENGLVYYE